MKKITIRKCTLKDADCILKIFNESISKGLTETKIKENLTSIAKSKVGRNQPCPCGSGKKYKYCCGAL